MSRIQFLFIAAALVLGILLGFLGAYVFSRQEHVPETILSTETPPAAVPATEQTSLPREETPVPATRAFPEPQKPDTAFPVMVSVCGAVKSPAVYRFEEGRRVQAAIDAAGGLTADADLGDINIAARLLDNSTLYIPFRVYARQDGKTLVARRTATAAEMNPGRYTRSGWRETAPAGHSAPVPAQAFAGNAPAPARAQATPSPATPGLVNLNRASLEELQRLPGIGPKTAEKIIVYREEQPFQRIEDLMEVHGIGDKKMEAVRSLVTLE